MSTPSRLAAGQAARADGEKTMVGKRRPYLAYLLRLWLVEDDGPVWRASLEAPGSAERHGFSSLDQLFTFLEVETSHLAVELGQEEDPSGARGSVPEASEPCVQNK